MSLNYFGRSHLISIEETFPFAKSVRFLRRKDGSNDTCSCHDLNFFLWDFDKRTHVQLDKPDMIDFWCGCSLNNTVFLFGSDQKKEPCLCYMNISNAAKWTFVRLSTFYVEKCFPLESNQILVVSREKDFRIYDPDTNLFSHLEIRGSANLKAASVVQDMIFFIGCVCNHDENVYYNYGFYSIGSKSWEIPIRRGSTKSQQRTILRSKYFKADLYLNRWIVMSYRRGHWGFLIFDVQTKKMSTSKYAIPYGIGATRVGVVMNHLVIQTREKAKYIDLAYVLPKWCIIGHLVLLRKLLEDRRADLLHNDDKMKVGGRHESTAANVTEKLMTDLDLYLFRTVLSFLVPD